MGVRWTIHGLMRIFCGRLEEETSVGFGKMYGLWVNGNSLANLRNRLPTKDNLLQRNILGNNMFWVLRLHGHLMNYFFTFLEVEFSFKLNSVVVVS